MTELPATPAAPAAGPTGSIYDIGYRRYEGPRLGRSHAIRSLFLHSLRSSFGIGRGGRAKVAPIILGVIALLPAIASTAALVLIAQFGATGFEGESPIRYDTYFAQIGTMIVLFCAAQAPELFGRDQRFGILALYFARALRRSDYALARMGGFAAALLIFQVVPQLVMFLGRVLLSTDIPKAIGTDLPSIPPILAQAVLVAGLLGGLSMVVAAFSPRRAYAVAGIIALFTIPSIITSVVSELGSSTVATWLTLLSPISVLNATDAVLFDRPLSSELAQVDVPRLAYVAVALIGTAASMAIAVRRFMRFTT